MATLLALYALVGFVCCSTADRSVVKDILVAFAWPLAVVGSVYFLRAALADFLSTIGRRVKKFSLAGAAIELSEASELRGIPSANLEDLRKLDAVAGADSSAGLRVLVGDSRPLDYVVVDLGSKAKPEWLSSRLFVMCAILERTRRLRCVVFLHRPTAGDPVFLGFANPRDVRRALAAVEPWLDVEFAAAYVSVASWGVNAPRAVQPDAFLPEGELSGLAAGRVLQQYLQSLQVFGVPPPDPVPPAQYVDLGSRQERASWVSPARLGELLRDRLVDVSVVSAPGNRQREAMEVLRSPGDFVAQVEKGHAFRSLVDRRALLETWFRRMDQEAGGPTTRDAASNC